MPEEAPFADAAPLPEPPPHPRLLRRLAAFGSPLPAGGERRGSASPCVVRMTTGECQTERDGDSPLPACGERVRPAAERAERSEAGVRGRCQNKAPFPDAAPLPETPPHPRLLRRLAAFGSPLPASGERRGAPVSQRAPIAEKPASATAPACSRWRGRGRGGSSRCRRPCAARGRRAGSRRSRSSPAAPSPRRDRSCPRR